MSNEQFSKNITSGNEDLLVQKERLYKKIYSSLKMTINDLHLEKVKEINEWDYSVLNVYEDEMNQIRLFYSEFPELFEERFFRFDREGKRFQVEFPVEMVDFKGENEMEYVGLVLKHLMNDLKYVTRNPSMWGSDTAHIQRVKSFIQANFNQDELTSDKNEFDSSVDKNIANSEADLHFIGDCNEEYDLTDIFLDRVDIFGKNTIKAGTETFRPLDERNRRKELAHYLKPFYSYLIDIDEILFEFDKQEPLYGYLCIYDVSKRERVSESLVFDFNHDNDYLQAIMTQVAELDPDMETLAKSGIFSFTQKSPSLYLVVRIARVFGIDYDNACDVYLKNISEKDRNKFRSDVGIGINRFGRYRQSFAWGSAQLFDENGKWVLPNALDLYRADKVMNDETLIDILLSESTKLKQLNGHLLLSSKVYAEEELYIEYFYDSNLFNIKASKEMSEDLKYVPKPVKKILDFVQLENYYPSNEYANNIYIYPQFFDFQSSKIKAKNVLIRAFVLDSDDNPNLYRTPNGPLEFIYGGSSSRKFIDNYNFIVDCNTKRPEFHEELKIRLPLDITDKIHICFVAYDVNEKAHKKGKEYLDTITLLGYSVLRLSFDGGNIVQDGVHLLPFSAELSPYYLSDTDLMEKDDDKNLSAYFSVRTHFVSTVFSKCPVVTRFLQNRIHILNLTNVMKNDADMKEIRKFFPTVMNILLKELSLNESYPHFLVLIFILVEVSAIILEHDQECDFVMSYIDNHMILPDPKDCRHPLYYSILTCWAEYINDKMEDEIQTLSNLSKYLFLIIRNSMVHSIDITLPQIERVENNTKKVLVDFMNSVLDNTQHFTPTLNKSMALWISDMFYYVDRGVLMEMIHLYLKKMNTTMSQMHKLKSDFLTIVSDHELFQISCLPQASCVIETDDMIKEFWRKHYFSGEILNTINQAMIMSPTSTMILFLQNVIWKLSIDNRYPQYIKTHLANIYLPLLKMVIVDLFRIIMSLDGEGRLPWFRCIFWIIRNADITLIRSWWITETFNEMKTFFTFLHDGVRYFKTKIPDLAEEAAVTVLPILEAYLIDQEEEFWMEENSGFFHLAIQIYFDCLQSIHTQEGRIRALKSLKIFVSRFTCPMFRYESAPLLPMLFEQVINYSIEKSSISNPAIGIICTFFLYNYLETNEISRTQLLLSIASFKLLENPNISNFPFVFDAILAYFKEFQSDKTALIESIELVFDRLSNFIEISVVIEGTENVDDKVDLLYDLANQCTFSCELRVRMLKRLQAHFIENEYFEEAAQIHLLICTMISEYSRMKLAQHYYPNIQMGEFNYIFPNVLLEPSLTDVTILMTESAPPGFDQSGFEKHLKEAYKLFIQGNYYELAVEVLCLMVEFFSIRGKYDKISTYISDVGKYSQLSLESNEGDTRIFSNFYRVGFYGPKFGELDNQEYVYKKPAMMRLADFSRETLTHFQEKIGGEIKVLPNKHRDQLEIDPSLHYVQIISLAPLRNTDRDRVPLTKKNNLAIETKFGINRFSVDFSYSPDGSGFTEDVDKQWKIQQIYETEKMFPAVVTRLKIVNQDQIIKGPLTCAIDLLEDRIKELRLELNKKPPNTKTLQIKLQGSVMLQVNAGPKAIAHYFLDPTHRNEWPPEQIAQLTEALQQFIRAVHFGLILNSQLVDEEQKTYQEALVDSYNNLCNEVEPLGIQINLIKTHH